MKNSSPSLISYMSSYVHPGGRYASIDVKLFTFLKVYTCVTCILVYLRVLILEVQHIRTACESMYVPALASSKHSSLWPFCLELGPDAWEMRKCLSIGPMAWRRKQMFIPLPSYFLSIIAASNEFERPTHTRARQSGWECVMVCTYNYSTSLIFVPGGSHAISLEDEVTTTALT